MEFSSSASYALPCLMLLGFSLLFSSSESVQIRVGDKKGYWNIPASPDDYTKWGERLRLKINDTLVMEYDGNNDSVLEVNESDYNNCKKDNPIKSFHEGKTTVTLDHSGMYYFISGANGHCEQGQKLAVRVLSSVHHGSHKGHVSGAPALAPAVGPAPALVPGLGPVVAAPAPAPASAGAHGMKVGIGGALMVFAGLALLLGI